MIVSEENSLLVRQAMRIQNRFPPCHLSFSLPLNSLTPRETLHSSAVTSESLGRTEFSPLFSSGCGTSRKRGVYDKHVRDNRPVASAPSCRYNAECLCPLWTMP